MTVMTKKGAELLEQLTAVAGDAEIVHEALSDLLAESSQPPELRDIIRRILEIRQQRTTGVPAEAR